MAWAWHLAGLAGILNFLVAGSVASLVFFARPSGRLNRRFGLFLWAAGLANLSYGLVFLQTSSDAASAWMAGNYVTTIIAFPALWYFAAAVPGTALRWLDRRAVHIGVWLTTILVPLLMLLGVLPAPQVVVGSGGPVPVVPTWWVAVGHVITASAAIVALLFVRAWQSAPVADTQRARAKALAIAMTSYLVVLVAANVAQLSSATWREHDLFMWSYTLAYLLLATIAGYGIVRHQLFDIDVKIKWTINRGTLAAIYIASFFIVSEITAGFLSDRIGLVAGVLVTGIMVFALAPLQRLADRVSNAALPHVQDTETYRTVRKREVYRAALEAVGDDGSFTERERDMLASLATQLGLTPQDVRLIERERAEPAAPY